MRVLLTRPVPESRALAATLAARGIASLIAPLLEIVPVPGAEVPLDGVQALLVTSANGARALAAATARRELPVLAVGESSAEAARAEGFSTVTAAGGDVEDLAALATSRLDPARGALVHAAGSAVTGDLAGCLAKAGFECRRAVLYEARTSSVLPPAAAEALAERAIDAVLFFSPRTATTFVRLVEMANLAGACESATALCLSPAVAAAAKPLPWRGLRVAARPEQASLLKILDDLE